MPVQSLGWEDPLEEEMAALSRILAWRIPWTEEPCGVQSTACTGVCVGVFKRVHLCVHVCRQPALSFSVTYGRQCCGGPPPGPGRASSREAAGTWTDRLQRDSPRREAGATFTDLLSVNTQTAA